MRYLTVGDVVAANRKALKDNETSAHNFGLLESAVLRPQTTIGGQDAYADMDTKAAVLFFSLVNNHAFTTANKRTAVLSVSLFYNLNGFRLAAADIDIYHLALDVATKIVDVDQIAARFKEWREELPLPEE